MKRHQFAIYVFFVFLFSISIIQHFGKVLPFFQWLPGVGDTYFRLAGPVGQQVLTINNSE